MWRHSRQSHSFRHIAKRELAIAILAAFYFGYQFQSTTLFDYNYDLLSGRSARTISVEWLQLFSVSVGIGIILLAVLYFARRYYLGSLRDEIVSRVRLKEIQQNESAFANRVNEPDSGALSSATSFEALWTLNQARIDLYHDVAREQATKSFRTSQWASGFGMLIIVAIAAIAAFAHNGTGAIAASVLGTAGAALTAYLGSTFMKTQAAAANQLRAYFLQPVEFARVLSAERLIEKLPESQRGAVVLRIVQAMTPASSTEQDPSATT
jgi:hypothetical protein